MMKLRDLLQSEKNSQELVTQQNASFSHVLRYRKIYLSLLLLLILLIPFFVNLSQGTPLLGGESYYHLAQAREFSQEFSLTTLPHFPLALAAKVLPLWALAILPIVIALLSLGLFFHLQSRWGWSEALTLIFSTLVILSPAFIFTFTTLSMYSYTLFLLLLGLVFLSEQRGFVRPFAIIPFLLLTLSDLFTIFLLGTILWYLWLKSKGKDTLLTLMTGGSFVLLLVHWLFLSTPLLLGPFHVENGVADLITDFGGLHGMGFFALLLALIGFVEGWKQERIAYLFFFILLGGFLLSSQVVFPLSLIAAYFAARAFLRLFERRWMLDSLKRFTFLVLILGVLFSTMTYLERDSRLPPTLGDVQTLTWLKEHSAPSSVVLSIPEYSYFITYFSERTPLEQLHKRPLMAQNQNSTIFKAGYITELFPLLEHYNISYIYIPQEMRGQLTPDQGLLFLLKNERFKLVHSYESNEVWMFQEE